MKPLIIGNLLKGGFSISSRQISTTMLAAIIVVVAVVSAGLLWVFLTLPPRQQEQQTILMVGLSGPDVSLDSQAYTGTVAKAGFLKLQKDGQVAKVVLFSFNLP